MRSRVLVAGTGILLALATSSRAVSSGDPKKPYQSRFYTRPHHHAADDSPKTRKYEPPPLKPTVHRHEIDDATTARAAGKAGATSARSQHTTSASALPRSQDAGKSPSGTLASHSHSSSRATTHGKAKAGSGSSSTHSKQSCGWTIRTSPGGHGCK